MADIFYHLKKGAGAYARNIIPYYFSVFTVLLGFLAMIFAGTLLVIFNSDPIFYSEEFLSKSGGMDPIELMLMLVTPSNVLIMFIFSFLAIVVLVYLFSGLHGVCLEGARGGASLRTFFASVFRRGGSYLLSSIVLFLLLGIFLFVLALPVFLVGGDLLLVLPSYLAYILLLMVVGFMLLPFVFLVPTAVVSGKGVHESFRQGLALARRNYFELLVLQSLVFTMFLACFIISIQLDFGVGFFLEFFILIPVTLFAICSYYIDRSLEKKPAPKTDEFPVDIVIPRARAAPEEKRPKREKEKKKPPRAAGRQKEIPVSALSGAGLKGKKRGRGIYVVASNTPITISGKPYKERKKKEAAKKKIPLKKPAAKKGAKGKTAKPKRKAKR